MIEIEHFRGIEGSDAASRGDYKAEAQQNSGACQDLVLSEVVLEGETTWH